MPTSSAICGANTAPGRRERELWGLTIVASLGCNFDCPYCYEDKTPALSSDEVAADMVRLVDDSLPNMTGMSVTWFGGEPLLAKRQVMKLSDAFIERCDSAGVQYGASIITNGWHLTGETAKALAERRVRSAQVTLDGPPGIHEQYRPTVSGKPSFWRIVENVADASEHMKINVRVNIDGGNVDRVEDLLTTLADAGLAEKVFVYPGRLMNETDVATSPSATYGGHCFGREDFSQIELDFQALATSLGFPAAGLPGPSTTPCVAVRATDVVVGPSGELWKCWDNVGDMTRVMGHISDYQVVDSAEVGRWLGYSPFDDDQCTECVALPTCMGGCAHHAFNGGIATPSAARSASAAKSECSTRHVDGSVSRRSEPGVRPPWGYERQLCRCR